MDDMLNSKDALRVTLEDPDVATFIRTHFSHPEKRPEITTQTTQKNKGARTFWIVEIWENSDQWKTMNIVIAQVDSSKGRVIKKNCLQSIFREEYHQYIKPRFT
jgi:hypothetical protein